MLFRSVGELDAACRTKIKLSSAPAETWAGKKKKNQLTKKENKKKKMVGGPGKGKEGKDPALHDCPRAEGEARGVEARSLWLNGRLKL